MGVCKCMRCEHFKRDNAWTSDLWGQGCPIEDWTCTLADKKIKKCVEFKQWILIEVPDWCPKNGNIAEMV